MTTVERRRFTELPSPDERCSNAPQLSTTSSSRTIAKTKVPPAVPSPPPASPRHSPPRTSHAQIANTPIAPMAADEAGQWLFTDAEIANSPSVLDGIPIAEERSRRAKAVNFIIQAGILLKLPQLTLATASVFFHRFYMRSSMVPEKGGLHHYVRPSSPSRKPNTMSGPSFERPPMPWKHPHSKAHAGLAATRERSLTFENMEQNIAATSLFLATKTEENCRKTKEIVIAVAKVAQKNASLIIDDQSKEYWRWRDNILIYEELMLELLTFDVVLQSPYTILYNQLQRLHIEDNKALRNVAWAFLNDSCLTMMCLLMPARDIAIAGVYFAAKFTGDKIPDDENGDAWWEQLGGKPERIVKAVGVMNEFYSENPLRRSENPYEQSPSSLGNEEDLDRTRSRVDGGSSGETPSPGGLSHSQRSQNERSQQEGDLETTTPVVNGTKTAEHHSIQQNENESRAERTTPMSRDLDTPGNSDARLKKAANDPATHEVNGHTNGMAELLNVAHPGAMMSPKRKNLAQVEELPAKRAKKENTPAATGEENEEGEVEE